MTDDLKVQLKAAHKLVFDLQTQIAAAENNTAATTEVIWLVNADYEFREHCGSDDYIACFSSYIVAKASMKKGKMKKPWYHDWTMKPIPSSKATSEMESDLDLHPHWKHMA